MVWDCKVSKLNPCCFCSHDHTTSCSTASTSALDSWSVSRASPVDTGGNYTALLWWILWHHVHEEYRQGTMLEVDDQNTGPSTEGTDWPLNLF